jgi:amino acid adenylation domain-containing protein
VPIPPRLADALQELDAHGDAVPGSGRLALLVGLVSRYVGPDVSVEVCVERARLPLALAIEDDDDLPTLARRLSAYMRFPCTSESSVVDAAPIVLIPWADADNADADDADAGDTKADDANADDTKADDTKADDTKADDANADDANAVVAPATSAPDSVSTRECDLHLSVVHLDGQLVLRFGTDGRYTDATRDAMTATFACVVAALSEDLALPLALAPVFDATTQERVLREWNATDAPRRDEELVQHALERLAARSPAQVVAELGGRTLSARELDARAAALAERLRAMGVAQGVAVGVAMERSFELLVALFGVLKAGGAFVAVDPELPLDRQAYLLSDADVDVLLTQPHLADAMRQPAAMAGATLLSIAPLDAHAVAGAPHARSRPLRGEDAAYLVYTSGSTGQPKGVRVPHRALANHARWFVDATRLGPEDRVLHYASISFDAALAELFAPIVAGALIVLAPPHAHRDLLGLFERVQTARITVLQAVPSVLRAALEAGALATTAAGVSTLRYIVSGGEALDHQLVDAVRARIGPDVVLGNFYGPSETCVDATMFVVDDAACRRRTIPIGRPVANMRCHILDRFLQPVPIGAIGELYVGGRGLALGYHGQPELTARKFVEDPFRASERLYRTGDLARYAADGTIEFFGRIDTQVKVRGYRLELAEIEAALRAFPGVRECAVVAPVDSGGERTLVAWITVAPGVTPPSPRAIAARLRQVLPAYAIPNHVGVLDTLPLNSSGKLDRRALEARAVPGYTACDEEPTREAIADPIARRLVPLWERVLGVTPIGLDDGFFDLGGHSLKAIRLLNDIEREFGLDVHAGVLFEAPTIRQLAARLQRRSSRLASTIIPIQPGGSRPPLFFVPGGGGELFVFEAIAQALGREQPLYVVDLYAFGERSDLPAEPSLTDIVTCIIADLRRIQPHGPYHLAGYSMGGKIALEMAQQLRAAGESIGAFVMLDADGPDYPRLEPLPRRLLTHARHALSLGPSGMVDYLRERLPRVAVRLGLRAPEPHRLFAQEDELDLVPPDVIAGMERAIAPLVQAWERYRPDAYEAPVTLLRAEVRQVMIGVSDTDPRLGWGPLLPRLRIVTLPCSHFDLLRAPNARRLADVITTCLAGTPAAP